MLETKSLSHRDQHIEIHDAIVEEGNVLNLI